MHFPTNAILKLNNYNRSCDTAVILQCFCQYDALMIKLDARQLQQEVVTSILARGLRFSVS